jgi:chromosomal replication initiation ATPase DnaA
MTQGEMQRIILSVCHQWGVTPEDVLKNRRFGELVEPRFAVMLLARELGASYSQIGRALRRDSTTVMNGVRRAIARTDADMHFARRLAVARRECA